MDSVNLNSSPKEIKNFLEKWHNNDARKAVMLYICDATQAKSLEELASEVFTAGSGALLTQMMLGVLLKRNTPTLDSLTAATKILQGEIPTKMLTDEIQKLIDVNSTSINPEDLPEAWRNKQ